MFIKKRFFIKFTTWVNFSVYPVFQWSNIVRKVLPKAKGSEKNIKRGDDHIVGRGCLWKGGGGGQGFKPWAHYETIILRLSKGYYWDIIQWSMVNYWLNGNEIWKLKHSNYNFLTPISVFLHPGIPTEELVFQTKF